MQRTSFMAQLNDKHFVYKEDLGGLCSECNECEYQVFSNIEELININITDLVLRVRFYNLLILIYFILTNFNSLYRIN